MKRGGLWTGVIILVVLSLLGLQQLFYPTKKGPNYRFHYAFGQHVLSRPVGIAFSHGRVYVTDTGHDRMVVFTPEGRLLGTGGERGSEPGQFRRPMHLNAGPDGNIYVADMLNHRVQTFTPRGKLLKTIGDEGTGKGEFLQPSGVAVDPRGNVYVTEFTNHRVQKLSPGGTFVKLWGHTGVRGILRYSYFNYPTDVAVASSGEWFVADAYNDRIKHYGAGGVLRSVWGGFFGLNIPGPFRGWFHVATGIGLSAREDRILVADFLNHRIQVMSPDGSFCTTFGEKGHGLGHMEHPTDVSVSPSGDIFLVDYGNNRIQVWKSSEIP